MEKEAVEDGEGQEYDGKDKESQHELEQRGVEERGGNILAENANVGILVASICGVEMAVHLGAVHLLMYPLRAGKWIRKLESGLNASRFRPSLHNSEH